eukprot:SAG11_NODE_497_length_8941_cov_5.441303_6_plen_387_part_00
MLAAGDMDGAELYRSIGVTPVINAVGSVTLLGGSTPDARVTAAMDAAAQSYAPMDELQLKAGQAIAQLVGAPAAMVTSGCAGAMVLAAAAAMTDNDPRKIIQLPDTTGLRSEILIQANQRYHYDRCWEMSGAKLVEYEPTEEALRAAISHRTAACVVRPEEAFPGSLPLPLIAAVAHSLGVSVMVDAAEQCYPLSNMTRFVEAGADCQCIAAKYLGSAQSTGLAIGTETFITSMFRNSFIGFERPDSSFGAVARNAIMTAAHLPCSLACSSTHGHAALSRRRLQARASGSTGRGSTQQMTSGSCAASVGRPRSTDRKSWGRTWLSRSGQVRTASPCSVHSCPVVHSGLCNNTTPCSAVVAVHAIAPHPPTNPHPQPPTHPAPSQRR